MATSGKRRRAREMAVQMLFQSDQGSASPREVIASFDPTAGDIGDSEETQPGRLPRPDEPEMSYATALFKGTLANREEIDALLREQAEHWRLERMAAVDRNILRLAVYELLFEADVPKLVVIDEAIELAKAFGSEESGRFVNGLLDGLLKAHEFPGTLT